MPSKVENVHHGGNRPGGGGILQSPLYPLTKYIIPTFCLYIGSL